MKKSMIDTVISDQQLEKEIKRVEYRRRRRAALRSTVSMLLVVAALVVLATSLWVPLFRITDESMGPLLQGGQVVAVYRTQDLKCGDIAVFYCENRVLVKRVIALPDDVVDIDEQGHLSVNGEITLENYACGLVLEQGNITYPYQVPDGCYFVMEDNQEALPDFPREAVRCIRKESVEGKIICRIWPLQQLEFFG